MKEGISFGTLSDRLPSWADLHNNHQILLRTISDTCPNTHPPGSVKIWPFRLTCFRVRLQQTDAPGNTKFAASTLTNFDWICLFFYESFALITSLWIAAMFFASDGAYPAASSTAAACGCMWVGWSHFLFFTTKCVLYIPYQALGWPHQNGNSMINEAQSHCLLTTCALTSKHSAFLPIIRSTHCRIRTHSGTVLFYCSPQIKVFQNRPRTTLPLGGHSQA